jgi:peptide-methionine (S)-S-oxide reductase
MPTETAIFAAGCFWGVEAEFRAMPGVTSTRVGYSGGTAEHPSYERVCRGRTGHAEAVEVTFDTDTISYEALLDRFWSIHNPTTRNRQGWDLGSQYRSAIFTRDDAHQEAALASRDARQKSTRRKIVTEIAPAGRFWAAEEYHQRYLEKQGRASCAATLSAA